jgi:hypothetical protein
MGARVIHSAGTGRRWGRARGVADMHGILEVELLERLVDLNESGTA